VNLENGKEQQDRRYFFSAIEGPMVDVFPPQALKAQTLAQLTAAAIALERYHLRSGKYPASLAELVPGIMKQVPVDYMDGKDLRYRLREDGSFLLYSVGEDWIDQSGDARPPEGKTTNFLNGRDWVWPHAAK